ncbi:hypothetical protein [Prochlorococcus marinus]|uniref:hypothetical protein n=1 Tax=Prochlorococcus marinus TaxID=1219 RepID=UPI0022B3BC29|nr:hypothetical protein [Prochlorococcus marinus]
MVSNGKEKTKLLAVSEIVHEDQLDEMKNNRDILQIGTRNMPNVPFLLHFARSGKSILFKWGFGTSIRDLIGATEYILLEGYSQLILCEIGIIAPHAYRPSSRFLFDLQAVPALDKAFIATNTDGLMLELYPEPSNSAVDRSQLLSFGDMEDLMPVLSAVAKRQMKGCLEVRH